jgi:hypothetical protein
MTNAEIIFSAEQALAKQGIIKYTGREFEAVNDKGETVMIKETEQIHTYATWKSLGYQVQKGQKAIANLKIWKHTTKENEETGKKESKMFLTKAFFFSGSQVAPIQ